MGQSQVIVECAREACYWPVSGHCRVCPGGLLWASRRSLYSVPGKPVMGQSQVIVECAREACYGPVAGHCRVCPGGLLWASRRSL